MSLNLNDPTATVVAAGLAALLALVSTVTTIALDYRRRNDERVREASRLAAERDQGTVTWLRKELMRVQPSSYRLPSRLPGCRSEQPK